MALLFMDGFDHYAGATAATVRKWTASRNGTADLTTGRFGAGWLGSNSRWTYRDFAGGYTTWICGVAFLYAGGDSREFLGFAEQGASSHVVLWYDPAYAHLRLGRAPVNSGYTELGSYAWSPGGAWHYIEMKATCDNATGSVEVLLNGVSVISVSGVDTRNGGTGVFNRLVLGNGGFNSDSTNANIDDLYLIDDSGGSPTDDFLGDCRVEALLPNGNGNSSQFVGSDANSTDNYLLVDEAAPNDDTDYVESSTVGNKDTYAYGNLAVTTGTVYGVQILPYARKTDAGVREFCTVTRLSGTEVDSADQALSTTYQYFPVIQEAKPGGGAWTIADVNAAEFGEKVTV